MAKHETGLSFVLHVHDNKKKFGQLVTGRPFVRPDHQAHHVWFKLDKNWAQVIDDEVRKVRVSEHELIQEAVLVQHGTAARYTPDGSVYPEKAALTV
jgi:hypothetical protein